MTDYKNPNGVDFGPVMTTPPNGAPNPVGPVHQFGVENNQVKEDGSGPVNLTEKAQIDLALKVRGQIG